MSLLHEAAYGGDLELVNTLLEINAEDIDEIDSEGRNALYEAAKEGHLEIVKA